MTARQMLEKLTQYLRENDCVSCPLESELDDCPGWEKWDDVVKLNRGCARRITRYFAAQEKPSAPKEPIPEVYLSGGAPPEAAEDALRNCTVTTTDVSPVYAGISGVVLSRDSRPVDPAKESDQ